jgi:hypothetical protein
MRSADPEAFRGTTLPPMSVAHFGGELLHELDVFRAVNAALHGPKVVGCADAHKVGSDQ